MIPAKGKSRPGGGLLNVSLYYQDTNPDLETCQLCAGVLAGKSS
jgi:hypothetical protein